MIIIITQSARGYFKQIFFVFIVVSNKNSPEVDSIQVFFFYLTFVRVHVLKEFFDVEYEYEIIIFFVKYKQRNGVCEAIITKLA